MVLVLVVALRTIDCKVLSLNLNWQLAFFLVLSINSASLAGTWKSCNTTEFSKMPTVHMQLGEKPD